MDFSPHHPLVKLWIQGLALEAQGRVQEADVIYQRAWGQADDAHAKFMAALFVARTTPDLVLRRKWLEAALARALEIGDDTVRCALPALYASLVECGATEHRASAIAASQNVAPRDPGPFFHGTKADLGIGDFLRAGKQSNYQAELQMNHVYFTARVSGAGLAAELAQGEVGSERVYVVEPTGPYEHDPNVTNQKFPGNPTRSYRSESPLKVVGEVTDWERQTPEAIRHWREKLAANRGGIIN